jgi:hypothetical protein
MRRLLLVLLWLVLGLSNRLWADEIQPRFEPQTIDDAVAIGYGVAIGDVDGDGKPDVLLADKREVAWYRNGDWQKFVMAADLTERDNVCIAARDITGDGRVEVAVGSNWNPGETTDAVRSGAVYYLIRPNDPTQRWEPVALHHEPTVHRMAWLKAGGEKHQLVVLPLHGRGNKNNQGAGVRILAYDVPADPREKWNTHLLDDAMHVTHNFDVARWDVGGAEDLIVGSLEGIALLRRQDDGWSKRMLTSGKHGAAGEVRLGRIGKQPFVAAVEPFHGNMLALYTFASEKGADERRVLADDLGEGHAIVCADFLGRGSDQIAVGWRRPNATQKVGLRLYWPVDGADGPWKSHVIDDNTMACEDARAADLDGDGRIDLVASGRATRNLVIYWNKTGKAAPR